MTTTIQDGTNGNQISKFGFRAKDLRLNDKSCSIRFFDRFKLGCRTKCDWLHIDERSEKCFFVARLVFYLSVFRVVYCFGIGFSMMVVHNGTTH